MNPANLERQRSSPPRAQELLGTRATCAWACAVLARSRRSGEPLIDVARNHLTERCSTNSWCTCTRLRGDRTGHERTTHLSATRVRCAAPME